MPFSSEEISAMAEFARRLAGAARGETLPRFRALKSVENKLGTGFDPVTDADREAERVMRGLIEAAYPEHGVIGEEFGERAGTSGARWILDPVDGTRAFVCGAPTWTTLIALEMDADRVIGVIDQPYADDCWIASGGATRHWRGNAESRCRTSGVERLTEARLSTTDPLASAYFTDEEAAAFARLNGAAQVARYSMDAYAYGLLASGQLDIVAETCLKLHDYAALAPVVEGAGGVITNWRGGPVGSDSRGEVLAAATPALHRAALEVLHG